MRLMHLIAGKSPDALAREGNARMLSSLGCRDQRRPEHTSALSKEHMHTRKVHGDEKSGAPWLRNCSEQVGQRGTMQRSTRIRYDTTAL
jgi:hypothetical protein